MRRLGLLVLAGFLASCAGRARMPPARTIVDADRLATAGCYSCLVDALKIYDTLLARRQSLSAGRGAFRTALLLALREKEVGLPATPYLERARAFAASLPPSEGASLALAVAEALPWEQSGLSREINEEFIKTRQASTGRTLEWRGRLRALRTDPFYAYLETSLACSYGDWRARDAVLEEMAAAHPASLPIKYRLGMCVAARRRALEEVLNMEPRYTEAHLFLGRYALVDASTGQGKRSAIAPHLETAYAAFPKSPSVTFTLAGMYRAFNKLKDALRFYDETLALVPAHREAMLGRIIALTYAGQPEAAIATATRMIELGDWYLGDAYYWRAFNLHQLRRLDPARDDVERAKQLAGLRPEVFLVAGIIYYDRRELDSAAADLEKAWQLSDRACDASWYLGLVRSDQRQWDVAAALFPRAAACYQSTADTYRAERGLRQAAAEEPGERAEIDAEFERLIEQQVVSESRSYYNAAYSCAQRGDRERAIEYAGRATRHPMMKDKAAELIAALKKSP